MGVWIGMVAALTAVALAPARAAEERAVPYWVSLAAGDALLRTGPGRNFPATWRYRRAELPLKVVQVHETWRKVREVDGTEGWMAAALLTADRTALVVDEVRPMRAAPDGGARIVWRAAPGVVGKVAHCASGWCEFNVQGRVGYIEIAHIWGVEPGDTID
jgi:SH3-like domain-containing protein